MNRYDDIENIAYNLISKYKTRNPLEILKYRGVIVMPFKGKTKLLGMYTILKNTKFVFFNPNISEEMKNMVFAHELGHDVLHQEEAKQKYLHEFELFNIETKLETEANLFASHILLDENEIKELASQNYTYDQIASYLNVNVNLLLFKISEMNRKNYRYNVLEKGNNKYLLEEK